MTRNELIKIMAQALAQSFMDRIATSAGMPFKETGVVLPNNDLWIDYATVALVALEETKCVIDYTEAG